MHPQLLHQLANDSVIDRRRHAPSHRRGSVRTRTPSRLRLRVGGVLIAVGTRLAGTRSTGVLQHHTSVPS